MDSNNKKLLSSEQAKEVINNELRQILIDFEFSEKINDGIMHNLVTSINDFELKIQIENNQYYSIKRSQAFSEIEKEIVKNIIDFASKNSKLDESDRRLLNHALLSRAISMAILKPDTSKTCELFFEIIECLEDWSSQTYEGSRISCSFGVDSSKVSSLSENFQDYIREDFAKVISNGFDTITVFDKNGCFLEYNHLSVEIETEKVPFMYLRIATFTQSDLGDKFAFVLNRNGEILIIKNAELVVTKRRGKWQTYNHDAIIKKMAFGSKYFEEEIRQKVYETCLDVSFSRHGGCIGIFNKTNEMKIIADLSRSKRSVVSIEDILTKPEPLINLLDKIENDKKYKTKTKIFYSVIKTSKFSELDRRMRQEIVGIDGATIIDSLGQVFTLGAILNIESGSSGGGRKAAAMRLANFGVGIKISADGEIIMFGKSPKKQNNKDEPKKGKQKLSNGKSKPQNLPMDLENSIINDQSIEIHFG